MEKAGGHPKERRPDACDDQVVSPQTHGRDLSFRALIEQLSAGDTVHYRRDGEIARGGMGVILKVRDHTLLRDLAMKVILDEEGRLELRDERGSLTPMVQRFLEEAQVTAQLDHPGIVPVYELGLDEDGRLYFTMKLVRGRTLGEIFDLAREGRDDWTTTRVLQVFERVCDALAFAHSKGVVHRDLKPANIMLGSFGEVYVMDWGLAKTLGARADTAPVGEDSAHALVHTVREGTAPDSGGAHLTLAGEVIGTPCYMPLEQARGRLDQLDTRSDIYAVGAMLYEFLAGNAPYSESGSEQSTRDVLVSILAGAPKPLRLAAPKLPPEIVAIVEKAMARDPANRYGSVTDLARDLRHFIEGRVVSAYRSGALIELHKWVLRNKAVAALGNAAIVLLVAGLVATSVFSVRAREGWDSARHERTIAEHERVAALALKDAAERKGYQAELAAIQGDLRNGDTRSAQARLAAIDDARGGWELDHVRSLTDQSITHMQGNLLGFHADGRIVLGAEDASVIAVDVLTDRSEVLSAPPEPAADDRGVRYSRGGNLRNRARFVAQTARIEGGLRTRIVDLTTGRGVLDLSERPSGGFATLEHPARLAYVGGGRLHLLDLETGKRLASRDPPSAASRFLDWSADGTRLVVVAPAAHRVWILDGRSLETLRSVATPYPPCARFDPTGLRLAICRLLSVSVLDVESGDEVESWQAPDQSGRVVNVAWRNDGKVLASLSEDGSVTIRDGNTGQILDEFQSMSGSCPTAGLDFSPDGTMLAAAYNEDVSVWPIRTQAGAIVSPVEGHVLRGHAGYVYPVAFSPDGVLIASGGWDGKVAGETGCVRIWDAATGAPIVALGKPGQRTMNLGFFPDSRRLMAASGGYGHAIQIYDLTSGALSARFEPSVTNASLSPDGTRIVGVLAAPGVARILAAGSGQTLAEVPSYVNERDGRAPLRFSPDGRWFATPKGNTVLVVDAKTYETAAELEGHRRGVWEVAFSPDGERVITTSEDCTARIWEVATGRELVTLRQHQVGVIGCAWSPDGMRIATGGRDRRIRIFDAETYEEIAVLSGHESYVFSLAFSPDGNQLISGSGDRTVRIWDTVPYGVRYRAQVERERFVRELAPRVQRLFAEEEDASQVAARLRDDPSLEGRPLEVALQLVLAEGARRSRRER